LDRVWRAGVGEQGLLSRLVLCTGETVLARGRDPGRLALILSGRLIVPGCTTATPCPSGQCVHRARRGTTVHGSGCGIVPQSGEGDGRTVYLHLVSARSCEPTATR